MSREYVVMVNKLPLSRHYGHTFPSPETARDYVKKSDLSDKAEIAELMHLEVYVPEEEKRLRGYAVEHFSSDGEKHLLKFCDAWEKAEKVTEENNGLNINVRKIISLDEGSIEQKFNHS